MPRALAPLRHGPFRLLAAGQFTSNLGDAFYAVAVPWYVLSAHGGALLLGSVLAAYGISRTVLLAVGGRASDRWRPWTVMLAADAVRAAAVGALAAAAVTGPPNPSILIPISVVIGAGEGLFLPGSYAIVPSLLPDAELEAGNAITTGGTELATLIGPGIGGSGRRASRRDAGPRHRRRLVRHLDSDSLAHPRPRRSRPPGRCQADSGPGDRRHPAARRRRGAACPQLRPCATSSPPNGHSRSSSSS